MKRNARIAAAILSGCLANSMGALAHAQVLTPPAPRELPSQLTPPAPREGSAPLTPPAPRETTRPLPLRKASPPALKQQPAHKEAPPTATPVPTLPAATTTAPAAPNPDHPDAAYGSFQRGFYLTAFAIATHRVQEQSDPKSMTLLGEIYANGYGIDRDDPKAAEWYRLAADRGDREATFALAMFKFTGRAGPANPDEGAKLLAAAAKLG